MEQVLTKIRLNKMEKRNFLMLLLGGVMMVPTLSMAYPDRDGTGGDDEHLDVHRSPQHNPYVYISYNECNGSALVTFNSAVNNAEILVYQNGVEVDYQVINATTGMQVPITLSAYGGGEFSIQVKSGTTLLAIYSINL